MGSNDKGVALGPELMQPVAYPFMPHQANRLVDRGLQRRREFVAKPTNLADRGPDENQFGQSPASPYDRKGRHEMMDPEGMGG